MFAGFFGTSRSKRRAIIGGAVTKAVDCIDVLAILPTGMGNDSGLSDVFVRSDSPYTMEYPLRRSENWGGTLVGGGTWIVVKPTCLGMEHYFPSVPAGCPSPVNPM